MNGRKIFIDSNIALYFLKGDPEAVEMLRDRSVVISFITELELLAFPKATKKSEKIVRQFIALCTVMGDNNEVRDAAIQLRLTTSLKLPDAIIAGTSAILKLPLITADKQFSKVENLDVIYYQVG
jgi:hypothetical protein